MSAARQLRALTVSYRALSTRAASSSVRAAQPARLVAAAFPRDTRSFSASVRARSEGASDATLSQRLQEEIKYEKESAAEDQGTPEFLKAFHAEQIWTIEEEQGLDEIALTRTFGNEHIRVMFSIADIDTTQPQTPEFIDETQEREDEGEEEEGNENPSYPVRTSITITKPGSSASALAIDTVCQDGSFAIDNIAYYQDAKLATELTAEADWKRRGLYIGPQFDHLDVNVQEEVEKLLRERGIAEGLALFIPEFAEYKEQKEYVKWLESVKKFIDV